MAVVTADQIIEPADVLQQALTDALNFVNNNPDCLAPGKNGEVISRKGMVVDRHEFEKMKDEYYEIRGWDVGTGLQRKEQLERLDLGDVAQELGSKGLLG